jgi:hypothetical protein
MGNFNRWAAALALCGMGTAVPAQARCWNEREVAAAQVREMQTMLMVAALRCRAAHIDISADYGTFVIAQKDAIDRANLVIKTHFAQSGGQQADYDRFATSLANGFGDDDTTEASCAEAVHLAHDGAIIAADALEALASARVFPAVLPEGACTGPANAAPAPAPALARPVTLASARMDHLTVVTPAPVVEPQEVQDAPAPVINLAPPPAQTAAVQLPADVVAAMTVLARFQAQQAAAPVVAPGATQVAAVQH